MHNEFTAVFERDDDWVIAYCPEIPGANGQGRTKDEARDSLRQAIALILEDRREEGLRAVLSLGERRVRERIFRQPGAPPAPAAAAQGPNAGYRPNLGSLRMGSQTGSSR